MMNSRVRLIENSTGVTYRSVQFISNNIGAIGQVTRVCLHAEYGKYHLACERIYSGKAVTIVGTKGEILVFGLTWGYPGEGPKGLLWLFRLLNMPTVMTESIDYIARLNPKLNYEFEVPK